MLELMPPFYFLTFAKVSVSVSKKFGLKKVSVSVSKTFGLEKKSRYWSRKHLVSKKSLGIGLENIWSQKKSRSRKFWSRIKVSVSVSVKFFGLVTQWILHGSFDMDREQLMIKRCIDNFLSKSFSLRCFQILL